MYLKYLTGIYALHIDIVFPSEPTSSVHHPCHDSPIIHINSKVHHPILAFTKIAVGALYCRLSPALFNESPSSEGAMSYQKFLLPHDNVTVSSNIMPITSI
jgi:hypothetical protein